MTIREVIERTDELQYNTYSNAEKIAWLSQLDWDVKRNVIDLNEGNRYCNFCGYNQETDIETTLLIPPPYDQMYLHWLEAQIHYYNGESERYNVAMILVNNLMDNYAAYYKRTHRPLSTGNRFRF